MHVSQARISFYRDGRPRASAARPYHCEYTKCAKQSRIWIATASTRPRNDDSSTATRAMFEKNLYEKSFQTYFQVVPAFLANSCCVKLVFRRKVVVWTPRSSRGVAIYSPLKPTPQAHSVYQLSSAKIVAQECLNRLLYLRAAFLNSFVISE